MSCSSSSGPHLGRRLLHHRERDARARVEVDPELVGDVDVGRVRRPDVEARGTRGSPPTRRDRRRPTTIAFDSVPFGVDTVVVSSHSGAFFGTRFWKNESPPAPSREPLQHHRPAAHRREQRLADRLVVPDEVELGLAPLGEEQLVGMGDLDVATVDLELQVVGHADRRYRRPPVARSRPRPIRGTMRAWPAPASLVIVARALRLGAAACGVRLGARRPRRRRPPSARAGRADGTRSRTCSSRSRTESRPAVDPTASRSAPTRVAPDRALPARPGAGRRPLIVFAHGYNGDPAKFTQLFEHWAEAGFAVLAPRFPITYTGATRRTRSPAPATSPSSPPTCASCSTGCSPSKYAPRIDRDAHRRRPDCRSAAARRGRSSPTAAASSRASAPPIVMDGNRFGFGPTHLRAEHDPADGVPHPTPTSRCRTRPRGGRTRRRRRRSTS